MPPGTYLGSSLLGLDQARSLWADAGLATVLARGTAFTLQEATGRSTPSAHQGPDAFRPFRADSFPSGHASQAFAMASAISMHAESPWVGAGAYGLATLVGLSRLETRDHFSSDVLAGALLGTGIGRVVVRLNRAKGPAGGGQAGLRVVPLLGEHFRGIQVVAAF
jgi:membrane-associated phospholipid phosphatase